MIATFVIYFHPSRLDNLHQVIRFLKAKETGLFPYSELLLLCQEEVSNDEFNDPNIKLINLHQGKYWKPAACNHGVALAQSDILVLLDSDRVMLRQAYFTKHITSLKPKTIVSPSLVLDLTAPVSDEDLTNINVIHGISNRYTNPLINGKTAFSGNTIMFKQDYLAFGGMDENIWGYGYHDNDATLAATKAGMTIEMPLEIEYHLWHPRDQAQLKTDNERNRQYFCKKWGLLSAPNVIPQ